MHYFERAYILGHGLQQHLRRPHPREQLQPEAAPEQNKSGRRVSPTARLISPFPNPRSPNPSPVLNPHPRPTDLWIRLFIDPSGALPNPIHARFICASEPIHQKTPPKTQMQAYCNNRRGRAEGARGGGSEHLVCDEVNDGLGLLRRRAPPGGDAAPEVPQRRRRRRVGAIAGGRRGGARAGEAPGAAFDGEDDDAGLHRAARWETAWGRWWRLLPRRRRRRSALTRRRRRRWWGRGVCEPRRDGFVWPKRPRWAAERSERV